jgi:ureidoglycolate lyase
MITLKPKPLTRAGFTAYGDVVEMDGANHFTINQGFAERYHDLANIDVTHDGGSTCVSVFEARMRPAPISIVMMERHPLGTQLFYPLQNLPWLIVVCRDPKYAESFEAFEATGTQGINYARGVWHHPLLVGEEGSRFMIVDRKGADKNLDEVALEVVLQLISI